MVKLGKIAALEQILQPTVTSMKVFSETVEDPTTDIIDVGVGLLQGHDSIIALGGGSPIDTAKAIGLLAKRGGKVRDYKVPNLVKDPSIPLVAIPTTAGTGSEVTQFTVITDTLHNEKMLIAGPGLLPTVAVVDYHHTLTVPYRTTADTGIDTLTHAIEAYVSRKANASSDVFALIAMRRTWLNLRGVCSDPQNHGPRSEMMTAAFEAGLAFSNASVALVHGMSRPYGAFFHISHGMGNAMLLPGVTAWTIQQAQTRGLKEVVARYAEVARACEMAPMDSSDEMAASALVEGLRDLNKQLKVPTPKAFGIEASQYESFVSTMASQAIASGSPNNNPVVVTQPELEEMYRRAYDGRL